MKSDINLYKEFQLIGDSQCVMYIKNICNINPMYVKGKACVDLNEGGITIRQMIGKIRNSKQRLNNKVLV